MNVVNVNVVNVVNVVLVWFSVGDIRKSLLSLMSLSLCGNIQEESPVCFLFLTDPNARLSGFDSALLS